MYHMYANFNNTCPLATAQRQARYATTKPRESSVRTPKRRRTAGIAPTLKPEVLPETPKLNLTLSIFGPHTPRFPAQHKAVGGKSQLPKAWPSDQQTLYTVVLPQNLPNTCFDEKVDITTGESRRKHSITSPYVCRHPNRESKTVPKLQTYRLHRHLSCQGNKTKRKSDLDNPNKPPGGGALT